MTDTERLQASNLLLKQAAESIAASDAFIAQQAKDLQARDETIAHLRARYEEAHNAIVADMKAEAGTMRTRLAAALAGLEQANKTIEDLRGRLAAEGAADMDSFALGLGRWR